MLNLLSKRDVAIVSHIPGTTRDILSVSLNIAGYQINLFDTAGLRDSNDAIEKEGMRRSMYLNFKCCRNSISNKIFSVYHPKIPT